MERGKTGSGRGSKSKTPQFPSDLYVLGPKGARSEGNEPKRPVPVHTKAGASHSLADRRRLAGSTCGPSISAAAQPAKKPKLTSAALTRPDTFATPAVSQDTIKSWEHAAVEIEAIDIVPTVEAAKEKDEDEKIVAVLCGALKLLKASKVRSDPILTSGLLYLAKKYPTIFTKETVFNALCSSLRRESSLLYKAKTTYTNAILIINVLYHAYQDSKHWPEIFMKLYIEDSLGERVWVDSEYCKCFADNITSSVHTVPSPQLDLDSGLRSDVEDESIPIIKDYPVFSRYKGSEEIIENIINEAVKDQFNRRQASEGISKHFLKFLSCMCGITEIRGMVSSKLEVWLTNPKLKRSAQELLMSVCVNCTSNTQRDVEIVASIVKIRLKTKDLSAFYFACIRELIQAHSKNLSTVLKQIVNNELIGVRNPNNMPMMAILFQAEPEQFAAILAEIFLEYLMNREDYLRPLRCLLREVTKFLRPDLDLQGFAIGLMSQTEPVPRDLEYKDRVFNSIADLVTLCIFLTISPHARSDRKDLHQIEKMQMAVGNIESDAVWWFHENAYRVYKPSTNDFVHALHKVVFMEPADQYYKVDNWPPEQDRALFIRYATEVPLLQRTVLTILAIGLSKEHPVSCADALELVEQLIKRASALTFSLSIPVLPAYEPKLIDLLFNLSAYRHPENIKLPAGYIPPDLAISTLYWKSWIILLIYCAHVPKVYGSLAWDKYPTLRVLIEMCITNHFVFPQASDDLQLLALEKQRILEFETYLAAASTKMNITESTSLLLSQLITMDPTGAPRRPPSIVLDQLQQLNASHKIGHLLCRSRDPDFLLDIIRKQGSSQSMPWLADLVQNSEGSFNHLPVQCLCEFLLSSNEKQQGKYQQLLTHLQSLLTDPKENPNVVCEILDHFLRRLGSHANKEQAISGLRLLLSTFNKDDMESEHLKSHGEQSLWILSKLPKIPHFFAARPQIVRALREACQVENDPELVTSYLTFLAQHGASSSLGIGEMTELVLDMAQLIVERSTIMPAVLRSHENDNLSNIALKSLMKIFYTYLIKAKEPRQNPYPLLDTQEQILIQWSTGENATLYNLVVCAVIILLTYGPQCSDSSHRYYDNLMQMWFPEHRELMPKAFLVDTSEEVLFIPDWLKLRMIRSNVPRLVDEALMNLEPAQLVLFMQSFGIPVESMSKLLETLDLALAMKTVSISDIAVDKMYIIQFVDAQHRRGVTGGNLLVNTIKTLDPEITIPESPIIKIDLTDNEPEIIEPIVTRLSDKEIEQIVENLHINSKTTALPPNVKDNRQKMLQMLTTELLYTTKSISYITPVFKKIVNTLRKNLTDSNFVNELVNNFHYPSHVFRLLTTTRHKDLTESLAPLVRTILKSKVAINSLKNPLVMMLKKFLSKNNFPEVESASAKQITKKESLDVFENCTVDELERIGNTLMDSEMKKMHGDKTVVESVANLITRSDYKYKNSTGLFIDWLIQIEPEIIGSSLELQLNMLFSQKSETKWKSTQICRPYLLTLLTHHASWTTLERALSSLLTLEGTKKYDATAVLEFLWALARNPRLWQGREKLTPKHQEPVDVLALTEEQLICVIQYVVLEVESYGCNELGLSKMSNRLSQLVECAIKPNNSKILITIVNHLNKESEISKLRKTICRNVIAHLYLRVPRIITLLNEMQQSIEFEEISKADRDSSILDVMSHAVLTSFTTNTHVKEWPKRAQELELIIRKMAATHPRLLLRQIRILETSLMGRIHLEWPIFRSRNHLSLFQQVFGILELLQPHLFSPEFQEPLHSIFDCYLNLFKNHGGMKDVIVLMNKFVTLLQNFIGHDTKRAVSFLQSRSTLLRELEVDHPCVGSLCVLMSGIRDAAGDKEILIPASVSNEIEAPQWDTIINSFKWEDPAFALLELDHASIRKPTLLEPMLEHLCPLLYDPASYNRSLAHMLLARCVKHNPNTAPRIVPAVFNCLHSDNPDIIETACDRLPELIVCSQENALPILRKLFSLVIRNGIDTLPCITKSLALLNLQSSC